METKDMVFNKTSICKKMCFRWLNKSKIYADEAAN